MYGDLHGCCDVFFVGGSWNSCVYRVLKESGCALYLSGVGVFSSGVYGVFWWKFLVSDSFGDTGDYYCLTLRKI